MYVHESFVYENARRDPPSGRMGRESRDGRCIKAGTSKSNPPSSQFPLSSLSTKHLHSTSLLHSARRRRASRHPPSPSPLLVVVVHDELESLAYLRSACHVLSFPLSPTFAVVEHIEHDLPHSDGGRAPVAVSDLLTVMPSDHHAC
ncbi:hypothetical protein D9611_009697 [Ephemerocybe angulata]|uniref:Uncharacterized protein n=1 Tax=Ephemerocybe angulata TaxID=980116 RepID=A0A8H5C5S8_9AGAR|nr:hypothetical protein D9611_009697 [Tulosesus angulatus]